MSETMDGVTNTEAKAALRNVGPLLQMVAMAHGGKLELTPAGANDLETILRFTEDRAFAALAQPAAPALPFDGEDVVRLKAVSNYLWNNNQLQDGGKMATLASRLEAALPGQGKAPDDAEVRAAQDADEAGSQWPEDRGAEAGKGAGDSLAEVVGHDAAGDVFAEIETLRRELSEARAAINALTAATPPAEPSAESAEDSLASHHVPMERVGTRKVYDPVTSVEAFLRAQPDTCEETT